MKPELLARIRQRWKLALLSEAYFRLRGQLVAARSWERAAARCSRRYDAVACGRPYKGLSD